MSQDRAATIRGQFSQFQRDIRGRKLRADREFPLGNRPATWKMFFQSHRITFGFDWKGANEQFERLASSAASALLSYRGRRGWMKWLEAIAAARLGDVVKVSDFVASGNGYPILCEHGRVVVGLRVFHIARFLKISASPIASRARFCCATSWPHCRRAS